MATLINLVSFISVATILFLASKPEEVSAIKATKKVDYALRDIKDKLDLSKLDVTKLATKSSRELKNDFKVLLTDMKLRQVPLSKDRSERALSKLYAQEEELKEQVEKVESDLRRVTLNSGKKIDIMELKSKQEMAKNPKASKHRMSLLTQKKIDEWQKEYDTKSKELEILRNKIADLKNIINNKGDYISVPKNFGVFDPVEQREREREVLLLDRENMEMRNAINDELISGKDPSKMELPTWMADNW